MLCVHLHTETVAEGDVSILTDNYIATGIQNGCNGENLMLITKHLSVFIVKCKQQSITESTNKYSKVLHSVGRLCER